MTFPEEYVNGKQMSGGRLRAFLSAIVLLAALQGVWKPALETYGADPETLDGFERRISAVVVPVADRLSASFREWWCRNAETVRANNQRKPYKNAQAFGCLVLAPIIVVLFVCMAGLFVPLLIGKKTRFPTDLYEKYREQFARFYDSV